MPCDPMAQPCARSRRTADPETEPAWQPFADVGVALVAVPAAGDTGFATIVTATITNKGPAVARSLTMTVELPAGGRAPRRGPSRVRSRGPRAHL